MAIDNKVDANIEQLLKAKPNTKIMHISEKWVNLIEFAEREQYFKLKELTFVAGEPVQAEREIASIKF